MKESSEPVITTIDKEKEVIKFANNIRDTADSNEISTTITQKKESLVESLNQKNLTLAIENLAEIKDLKDGITWHLSEDKNTLIRDARGANKPIINPPEAYAMQYLNQVRAADLLLEQAFKRGEITEDKVKEAQNTLLEEAKSICIDNNLGPELMKQKNSEMAKILEKAGIPEAKKKMKVAKDFANFKDKHRNICTMYDIEGKTVIEADIKNTALTASQKNMYNDIFQGKENKIPGMKWYNEQPEWKQDLVKSVAGEIAKGDHVIPTQLRKELIGMRNSYTKLTLVADKGKDFQTILKTHHSGAISFHGKGDKQAIADENAKQLNQNVGGDFSANILNTPNIFQKTDSEIYKQTKKTTKSFSIAPVNLLRKIPIIGGGEYSGFKKTLNVVADICKKKKLNKTAEYLKSGSKKILKSVLNEIEELSKSDKELASELKHAVEAKKLTKESTLFSDKDNTNVQISSRMKIVTHSLTEGKLSKEATKHEVDIKNIEKINTNCASGKDRTGLVEADATFKSLCDKIGEGNAKKILEKQMYAGHTQMMAGIQGGTIGCFGVKPNTAKEAPEQYKDYKEVLGQKTADFNKFKTNKKDKLSQKIFNKLKNITNIFNKPKKDITNQSVNNKPITQDHSKPSNQESLEKSEQKIKNKKPRSLSFFQNKTTIEIKPRNYNNTYKTPSSTPAVKVNTRSRSNSL